MTLQLIVALLLNTGLLALIVLFLVRKEGRKLLGIVGIIAFVLVLPIVAAALYGQFQMAFVDLPRDAYSFYWEIQYAGALAFGAVMIVLRVLNWVMSLFSRKARR